MGDTAGCSRVPEAGECACRSVARAAATAAAGEDSSDPPRRGVQYEALLAKYPDEEDAYTPLALAYEGLGDRDKALATMERGVKAIPKSGPCTTRYGNFWLSAGRYTEAIHEFEEYVRLRPSEPNPLDSLAERLLISGQPEKALGKFTQALGVSPDFNCSYEGRAIAYAVLGRYDDASKDVATYLTVLKKLGVTEAASAIYGCLFRVACRAVPRRRGAESVKASWPRGGRKPSPARPT